MNIFYKFILRKWLMRNFIYKLSTEELLHIYLKYSNARVTKKLENRPISG